MDKHYKKVKKKVLKEFENKEFQEDVIREEFRQGLSTFERWLTYMEWCQKNRCFNDKCFSNSNGVCEDARGINHCKSYQQV